MAQFTIAARDVTTPFTQISDAVQSALLNLPDVSIVRLDSDVGLVVVEAPSFQREAIRSALGADFIVDPNSALKIQNEAE